MASTGIPQEPSVSKLLAALALLVGEWELELAFPNDPSNKVQGKVTFSWIEANAFVVMRLGDSSWIMGPDESSGEFSVLYHDGRGASRVYQMSLDSSTWKMWRDSPDFSQRFEGNFDEDKNSIAAHWEKSTDGSNWQHDFDMTYRRKEETEPPVSRADSTSKRSAV